MADKKTLDDVSGQGSGLAAMTQEVLDGAVSYLLDPAAGLQNLDDGAKGFSGHGCFLSMSMGARFPDRVSSKEKHLPLGKGHH
jgi:hypothetical protein